MKAADGKAADDYRTIRIRTSTYEALLKWRNLLFRSGVAWLPRELQKEPPDRGMTMSYVVDVAVASLDRATRRRGR